MTTNLSLRAGVRGPVATSNQLENADSNLGLWCGHHLDVDVGKGIGSGVLPTEEEGAELLPDQTGIGDR